MKKLRRLTALILLAAVCLTVFPHAAMAGWLTTDVPYENIEQIHLPFASLGGKILEWDFPYTDEFFIRSSEDFSIELAQASMGLTVSAFRYNGTPLENQYETYLGAAGFTDITPFGYDRETGKDTLSGIVARKTIGDFTLIAAAPNGYGYKNEWGGNLEVGTGERHEGFDTAAKLLESKIDGFIAEHQIEGKMKLWVTGFSRASAVGNLTAADMIESGRFDDVFAYLFGVPRTTKAAVNYPGIFNICGKYDPVTQVPPESWGFERYGTSLYTPAEETDTQYPRLLAAANEVSQKLTGQPMRNNPEINYQLHMIIEFVYELFPDQEAYNARFQEIIVRTFSNKNLSNFLETLLTMLKEMDKMDRRLAYSSSILEDYLSYIIAQHASEKQQQIEQGRWDPALGLSENLMREHIPYTYISWLFADIDTDQLLNGHAFTRRVVITADDTDVEVLREGRIIGGVDRNGKVLDAKENLDPSGYGSMAEAHSDLRSIFAIRNGAKTVVSLPMNDTYTIRIRTHKMTSVSYYDVFCSPFTTYGSSNETHVFAAGEGEYEMQASYAEPLSDIEAQSGWASNVQHIIVPYSTTLLMSDEADSLRHITVTDILQNLSIAMLAVLVLLLICLIISLVHRRGKKKSGRAYSDLYVIVPHLIVIGLFAFITQFFTINIFSIGVARSVFAGLTVFVMFLLALRGTLRNRSVKNLVITVLLLLAAVADGLIYQRSELVSASGIRFAVYCVAMAGLTVLAVSPFFRDKSGGEAKQQTAGASKHDEGEQEDRDVLLSEGAV
ncbi:MAG: hypothetical protein IJK47_06380 [Lachnospiraceae bacterium]|nr:hypothetical protein [Lachnospiraceae bacterium]